MKRQTGLPNCYSPITSTNLPPTTNMKPTPIQDHVEVIEAEIVSEKKRKKPRKPGTPEGKQETPTPPSSPHDDEPIVEEVEPWDSRVELLDLVEEIEDRLERHIVMPSESRLSIALWVASSYCYDSFRIFPRMVIHSPEKRCGKTTTMEIIDAIVNKGILASNCSSAAVFRVIEEYAPTLIIDEADSFLKDNEALRGIINSSHTKKAAFVIRCEGDSHQTKKYSTWAPIVLGGIKRVADTIEDRSIVIELQRKLSAESVERLPVDLDEVLLPLRRKLTRWRNDNFGILKTIDPSLPDVGNDRAADNWFPMFALAEMMGSEMLERTTLAFINIESQEKSETLGTTLLADIKKCFEERNVDRIWTRDLIAALTAMEERPWETWKGGFTSRVLSNLLKDFGVKSADIRMGGSVSKGYDLEKFEDAFRRYLTKDS